MKKHLLRIAKIAVILAVVFPMVFVGQKYFFRNYDGDTVRVDGFYLEDENSLDVVVLGASDVFSDYSAALAYKEYGFTSYPVCVSSNPISLMKYELAEVMKHQSPKLIVVEINSALYDDDTFTENEADKRRFLDSMPMSANKISAIAGTCEGDTLSYVFPFVKYHGNWTDYRTCLDTAKNTKAMQKRGYALLKGNLTCTKAELFDSVIDVSQDDSKLPLNSNLQNSLVGFLDYCKSENIENIVFVRFPHAIVDDASYERFQRSNTAEEIIRQYGYDFINFEKETDKIGIDFSTDFYNADHMNVYGQAKFTRYISSLISIDYVPNEADISEEQKEEWEQCVSFYDRFYKYAEDSMNDGEELWLRESVSLIEQLGSIYE